jgi:2',3'-cyclic-nucleotide 2'-phosphodiesterase (5'-nucleotidase family)
MKNKFFPILMILALTLGAFLPTVSSQAGVLPPTTPPKVIFFVADGMRQDLLSEYFTRGLPEDLRDEFLIGAMASDNGLQTQAPANTGSGWYTLMTGAWAGVHGSTNNTFHKNGGSGTAFLSNRTAAFDAGVLQAESLAQSAERGGKKVIQFEFAGGRNASITGPTVDYRNFFSGRGVVTNYISPMDDAPFVAAFGLQFDHPAGFSNQAPYAEAAPAPADPAWVNTPVSYSPAMQMRMRVLDFGTDKYGLYAYIYDSTDDGVANYDRVLFAPVLDGAAAVADLTKGEWGDVKVKIVGGTYAGLTAGFLVKVEELTPDLSMVRLFHSSAARAIAKWAGFPGEAGYTDFEEFLAAEFPSSTAADYAILEAGIVSEDTYAEQGLAWDNFAKPVLEYLMNVYQPDLAMVGYPTIDEFQHQFMGLVTPTLPNGEANPAYDDVLVDGTKDGLVAERQGYLKAAYQGAAETYVTVRRLMPAGNINSFVASDHGFAAQFLAIDASQVLVNLGLLSKPQTSNCRTASGEAIGSAKACWAGGTVQIYLNVAGRDPAPAAGSTIKQIKAADVAATVQKIEDAFAALVDPNDWNKDGAPDGWMMIDRMFTKAEARYIPNGSGGTADMAHPTRTGDLVVFSYPPYQFDAATPGTLVALSHFFGQHGYVPDVQMLEANVNMRATFLAAGRTIIPNSMVAARSIDLAPTIAYVLDVPAPQHSQGRVLTEILLDGASLKQVNLLHYNDYHGQLSTTTVTMDGLSVDVGGAAYLATLFDENAAQLPGETLLFSGGDNVGATPPNSGLLEDMPTINAMNAWGVDASTFGNHEFDYGLARLANQQAIANNTWLVTNIVDEVTGQLVPWAKPSEVFLVNGVKVGVIGAALEVTPELVNPVNLAGLKFLPAAPAVIAESQRLEAMGVKVQVLLVHEGIAKGQNTIGSVASIPWEGPIITLAQALQDTTIDLIAGGHTHWVANTMVGKIAIVENQNAGKDITVSQLLVANGDVVWAGTATRMTKTLGVTPRADVKAIVDQANADIAPLANVVIGTQQFDILRDPTRLNESAMGNMAADALRWFYTTINPRQVDGAITNSGGLRADIKFATLSGGELPGEITWGEMFAVLPFGNSTVVEDMTGAQFQTAFLNGFGPKCDTAISTGRFPQVSGFKVTFHCDAATKKPIVDGMWKTPDGPGGVEIPILPTDVVRIVTNDFMYYGGDGYTVFGQGTNVFMTGDLMLDVAIKYVSTFSPVGPVVDGRVFFGGTMAPEFLAPVIILQNPVRLPLIFGNR